MIARGERKGDASIRIGPALADVHDLKSDLAGRSIRGSSSLVVSEIGCNIFRLLGTMIMARLLTPEHFGLIGMVTALTAFAEMFKDLGLGTATIQQKVITHKQISTLFWVNTAVGAATMLLLAGAAPLISWFYGDTRLFWIAIAISSTFLFGGLTVQHQALLRRQMQFTRLAFITVLSTALSTVIGILLAWQGFEYWALVWKEVSRAIIQASATWMLSHWLPGFPQHGAGVRRMIQTGSHVTGFNILVFASGSLDQVLLGKFWGAGPVGLYKQTSLLLRLPVSLVSFPITYVMTPALSALQGEPERYRRYYEKVISFMSFVHMPIVAYIAIFSESIIRLVLGEKWLAASAILQILAVGAVLEPIVGTCGIVMITCGRTRDYLRMGVVQAISLSIAVGIGINWGFVGVAVAVATYAYLGLLPLVWFSFKDTPLSVRLLFEVLSLPALACIAMSILLIAIRYVLEVQGAATEIAYSLFLAPLFYCGVWMLLPRGKQKLAEYFSHFRLALVDFTSRVYSPTAPKVSGL